ncbi:MAG: hypothetical protein HUU22_09520 [Phycisphaerae bacterium]|nr:hypothetical protein [Phycisphaerae bacterium]NUQ46260.1 hypothetical protein [Phycisphaerae bacterium]
MSRGSNHPAEGPIDVRRMRGMPIFLLALTALVGLGAFSSYVLAVVVFALPCPVLILAASTSLGAALITPLLRMMRMSADLWILSAALGIGLIALLVLMFGVLGVMSAAFWWTTLFITSCLGVLVRLSTRSQKRIPHPDASTPPANANASQGARDLSEWLWLLAAPFAAMALLAASMPPGVQWIAEGNGYDVLEYHLAVPKEYFLNGRINYLPHNIYANMPFNAEMLYLLCMILIGDPIEAAIPAQMLNTLLAALAAACCWAAARPFGRGPANVAGVVVATCPMICYLCGVAYVENGLLAMTAAALACAIRAFIDSDRALRWSILAGCFAGLACGFKYTAVPMVALPIALAARSAVAPRGGRGKLQAAGACGACAVLVFSPWLVKNAVYTGNPVFPLIRTFFPERPGIWSDELAAHWHEGHLPDPRERSVGGRLRALGREVLRPAGITDEFGGRAPQYGLPAWGLPLALFISFALRRFSGATARSSGDAARRGPRSEQNDINGPNGSDPSHRSSLMDPANVNNRPFDSGLPARAAASRAHGSAGRTVGACVLVIIATLTTWLISTHLVGRFALPILPPLAILAGLAWLRFNSPTGRALLALLLAGGAALNTWELGDVVARNAVFELPQLAGRTDLLESGQWPEYAYLGRLNELLDTGHRVLLVGEARTYYLRGRPGQYEYCVVFNRNSFAEATSRQTPPEVLGWLRERGISHMFVHWVEMRRLRSSRYGFWRQVDEPLFGLLQSAGLKAVEDFRYHGYDPRPFGTLFTVP